MYYLKPSLTHLMALILAFGSIISVAGEIASLEELNKSSMTSSHSCIKLIDTSINKTQELNTFTNPVALGVDAAVVGGTVAMTLPTAFAALPAGATLLVARNLGVSTYKEAKLSSQERAKQIVLDAVVYKQLGLTNKEVLANYPALGELMARVNGPVNTLLGRGYSAEEVAGIVVKAINDPMFCANSSNFRMVHFKDYVLTHI